MELRSLEFILPVTCRACASPWATWRWRWSRWRCGSPLSPPNTLGRTLTWTLPWPMNPRGTVRFKKVSLFTGVSNIHFCSHCPLNQLDGLWGHLRSIFLYSSWEGRLASNSTKIKSSGKECALAWKRSQRSGGGATSRTGLVPVAHSAGHVVHWHRHTLAVPCAPLCARRLGVRPIHRQPCLGHSCL